MNRELNTELFRPVDHSWWARRFHALQCPLQVSFFTTGLTLLQSVFCFYLQVCRTESGPSPWLQSQQGRPALSTTMIPSPQHKGQLDHNTIKTDKRRSLTHETRQDSAKDRNMVQYIGDKKLKVLKKYGRKLSKNWVAGGVCVGREL